MTTVSAKRTGNVSFCSHKDRSHNSYSGLNMIMNIYKKKCKMCLRGLLKKISTSYNKVCPRGCLLFALTLTLTRLSQSVCILFLHIRVFCRPAGPQSNRDYIQSELHVDCGALSSPQNKRGALRQ